MTEQRVIPLSDQKTKMLSRIARARSVQKWVMLTEEAFAILAWPVALTLFFAAAGLFRLPQSLPDMLHALLTLIWIAVCAALLLRGFTQLRRPAISVIDRRVEAGSKLHRHALKTFFDRPISQQSIVLWDAHLHRVLSGITYLRPSFHMPRVSRSAANTVACGVLLSSIGLCIAGGHALSRLNAGFIPGVDDDDTPLPDVQAWINAPAYLQAPPRYLNNHGDIITTGPGAELEVQVTGLKAVPWLTGITPEDTKYHRLVQNAWHVRATLLKNGALKLRGRGRIIAQWTAQILPNPPPVITWDRQPEANTALTRIKATYRARQPFGVASVTLIIKPEARYFGANNFRTTQFPDHTPRDTTGTFSADVAQLPYAGERVTLQMQACSTSGQCALSTAHHMALPVYPFADPISRALIDLRQRVLKHEESLNAADRELAAIIAVPLPSAKGVGLLAARMIHERPRNLAAYADGLWAIALYLDDVARHGRDTADANLALRAAQKALQSFLEHNADTTATAHQAIDQIRLHDQVNAMRHAVQTRMRVLMYHAMLRSGMVPDPGAVISGRNDAVTKRLNIIEERAGAGDVKSALRQLENCNDMIRRLRDATAAELEEAARQQMLQMQQSRDLRVVQDLIARQSDLLDAAQARQEGAQRLQEEQRLTSVPDGDANSDLSAFSLDAPAPEAAPNQDHEGVETLADRALYRDARRDAFQKQGALRDALVVTIDDMASREGQKIPDGLQKARQDMGAARAALATRRDDDASTALKHVLEDLTQAGRDMKAAQKARQHGDGPTILLPTLQSGGGETRAGDKGDGQGDESDDDRTNGGAAQKSKGKTDALGRKINDSQGQGDSDHGGMIDHPDLHRLGIEQELRRRATDRTRPMREQHYLRDLLKSWRGGW